MLVMLVSMNAYAQKPVAPETLPGATAVNAEKTIELIMSVSNLQIIDSRKENEFQKGHIQGAVSLLDTAMTEDLLSMHVPDKNTPVLFYCNGVRCLRSSRAATKALEWGYTTVYWFRGGWSEWVKKGMPVSR